MPDQVVELAELGRALAPNDRSRLVDLLLESLHESPVAEVEAAWEKEIDRRLAEYDRGDVKAIDAEEVFAKARRIAR
jgi:putative addiction module component (TIGR02574 family)